MLYIRNESTNPYFNLAMEEYLFNQDDGENYVLFWQNEPTIVVGKHQNTAQEINSEYVKEKGIHVVRRITGGGAVYHDLGNLNFTFIFKGLEKSEFDFRKFTMPIIKALGKLGVESELSGRNDITIDGKKFSGNAQAVKQGKLLHHGTILFDSKMEELAKALKVSQDKFQSKGVKSVRARVTNIKDYLHDDITVTEFKELLLKYMFDEDTELKEGEPSKTDLDNINSLMNNKYMSWDWNYGESPEFNTELTRPKSPASIGGGYQRAVKSSAPGHLLLPLRGNSPCMDSTNIQRGLNPPLNEGSFNVKQGKRFGGGKTEVLVNVREGIIRGIKFYGDFFGSGNLEEVESVLIGKRYEEGEIRVALTCLNIDEYFKNITVDEIMSCIL